MQKKVLEKFVSLKKRERKFFKKRRNIFLEKIYNIFLKFYNSSKKISSEMLKTDSKQTICKERQFLSEENIHKIFS